MIRVLFFGTPLFAARILEGLLSAPLISVAAVVTQPDKPRGRGNQLAGSPVKELAITKGIPVLQPERIRRDQPVFLRELSSLGPFDVGVVVAFGQILPIDTLRTPIAGCVNIHASLLPRWRGAAPIHRAVMAGDAETGVCLMQMDEGLDTGPVYSSKSLPISPQDTTGSMHDSLADLGSHLLVRDLAAIVNGSLSPSPQPLDGVTYAEKIRNEECIIPWEKSSFTVARHIMGLSPFPGAFAIFRGERVKIYRATSVPSHGVVSSCPPGTVVRADKLGLEVQCGQGLLSLEELQCEGRKRLPIEEFMKGALLTKGDRFESTPL